MRLEALATPLPGNQHRRVVMQLKPPGPKEPGFRVDALSPTDTTGRP